MVINIILKIPEMLVKTQPLIRIRQGERRYKTRGRVYKSSPLYLTYIYGSSIGNF